MLSVENEEVKSEKEIPSLLPSIRKFYFFIVKKWWLFLIVGLFAGIAGYFYAAGQKPIYKSKLTFALDEGGSSSMSGFASLVSQFGIGSGGSNEVFAGDNILQIMKSRRMVERVLLTVDTFKNKPYTLVEYYLEKSIKPSGNTKKARVKFPVAQERKSFTVQQDSVLMNIYKEFASVRISASRPDRKLNIFEVNITTPDEELTKVFTDKLVYETNKFYTEIRTKKAKETLEILEDRVAAMKGNLDVSISTRASVQDANLNPVFSAALVPVIKQQANIQAYTGAYGEMFKNLEIARFQYLNEIPLMQIIDDANYPMEKIKLGKLKTAIIFSGLSFFLLLFILWFIRILRLSKLQSA